MLNDEAAQVRQGWSRSVICKHVDSNFDHWGLGLWLT
jgi:hypothetical protein